LPLYEYRCLNCDAHFEKIQKFSDPPIKKCQVCGGPLEQLLSSPAIQFKGSGWYVTDYAKKSSAEPSSKGDGAPSAKSESKPAEPKASERSKTPEPSKTP
jgi:putative FmdB family regulatory protein